MVKQAADNIYQVRIPLPFALSSVNCYLLGSLSGWTVLDTGLNTPAAQAAWQQAFQELGLGFGEITQVVLTHVHPDHYGMAGWFQTNVEQYTGRQIPVFLSPREAELVEVFWRSDGDWAVETFHFWMAGDVPEDLANGMIASTEDTRRGILPHAHLSGTITDGDTVLMGEREFTAMHMPGHSDGQMIFYDANDRLLLCGDHVLTKITPNIGLWPNSDPDPLGSYLATFDRLHALDVRLALPGHGPLIDRFSDRLVELQKHHEDRLGQTMRAANGAATGFQAAQKLFPFEKLGVHERRFALAETLAHLEYLVRRGMVERSNSTPWQFSTV